MRKQMANANRSCRETQIQSGPNTRKWAADRKKGKLPLFKLRTGKEEEEVIMQVDGTEEEEKAPDTDTNITLEETEIALKLPDIMKQ